MDNEGTIIDITHQAKSMRHIFPHKSAQNIAVILRLIRHLRKLSTDIVVRPTTP